MRGPAKLQRGLLIIITVFAVILSATCLFGEDDNTKGNVSAQISKFKTVSADMRMIPEPDPPKIDIELEPLTPQRSYVIKDVSTVEWTYHKTADNDAHPDGNEQQLLWLMNQARSNPTAEGLWLATVTDTDITSARSYFGVDLQVLQDEFAGMTPSPGSFRCEVILCRGSPFR